MRQHSTELEMSQIGLHFTYRLGEDRRAPLVLLIHGRAGNRDVMWLFERVLPHAATIVSFQAPEQDAIGGFSWWDLTIAGESRIAAPRAARTIASALTRFEEYFGVTPARRVALGFSQGAAVLSTALQEGTIPCDGFGLLAGMVVRCEGSQSHQRSLPVFIGHGVHDEIISIQRAYDGRDFIVSLGHTVEFVEDPVGHKVGVGATKALGRWVERVIAE